MTVGEEMKELSGRKDIMLFILIRYMKIHMNIPRMIP